MNGVRCETCGWARKAEGKGGFQLAVLSHLAGHSGHTLLWPEEVTGPALTAEERAIGEGYRRGYLAAEGANAPR